MHQIKQNHPAAIVVRYRHGSNSQNSGPIPPEKAGEQYRREFIRHQDQQFY